MLFKIKKMKFILLGLFLSVATTVVSSCVNSVNNYINSLGRKTVYFSDLIRLKQEKQNITTNNSIIFDQFFPKFSEFVNEYRNFSFLDGASNKRIKSISDFNELIINKINTLYKDFNLAKLMSDAKIKQIFESDFLKGQTLEKILEQNDILLFESSNAYSASFLNYFLIDTNDKKENQISILEINPEYVNNKFGYKVPQNLIASRNVFTAVLIPKAATYKIIETKQIENIKLLNDLYNEFKYKLDNFIKEYEIDKTLTLIQKIQQNQNVTFKPFSFLGKLNNESIKNLTINTEIESIENMDDFNKIILTPLQKIANDNALTIDTDKIRKYFEQEYIENRDIETTLKENKILVQRMIINKNYLSFNTPDQMVKYKQKDNNITIATISDRVFNYNFSLNEYTPKVNENEVLFQVLVVPKNSVIKLQGSLSYKEANDFLVKNKDLLPKQA
ncbi:hypothetical protein BCF59_0258 [Mycoplasmopsis mustelae]|uniref:Lipoprotein n=2 Tax=Mycoplasmopsis mustelae TaxID=171289 RepID=A0A4R7UD08_9BACT|nr:hypothetical protein BCF59_0258 [Mycoplasmopsis mustelae]